MPKSPHYRLLVAAIAIGFAVAAAVGFILDGGAGLGIGLGVASALVAIWAASIAARADEQGSETARAAAQTLDRAERIAHQLGDLASASRAERAGRVKEAVRLVLTVVKTAEMEERRPDLFADDPAPITVITAGQLASRLGGALGLAGRLQLPSCWALLGVLAQLLGELTDDLGTREVTERLFVSTLRE